MIAAHDKLEAMGQARQEVEAKKRQDSSAGGKSSVAIDASVKTSSTKNTQSSYIKTQPDPLVVAVANVGME